MDFNQLLKLEPIGELVGNIRKISLDRDRILFFVIIVLAVTVLVSSLWKKGWSRFTNSFGRTATPYKPKNPLKKWNLETFQRPTARPYPDWDLNTTKPIPYRPFRYGPYYITMGIRRMHWDEWIELDNQYLKYHARKIERIAERGPQLSRTAPEAYDGAHELLEELCSYLPERYPSLFRRTAVGMDNLCTGESFNITERPLVEDPMQIAARLVQDDIAMMFEKADGEYYLLAATVMLPGAWRLKDKFGMSLSEIHLTGHVPGYKTKLEKGMTNFFRRIPPQSPVLRNNYFFQTGDDLAWNRGLGLENFDEIDDGSSPSGKKTVKHHWGSADGEDTTIDNHYFRTERQSLRRLPRSGAVVFTFRTYLHPVIEIAQEPGVPGRLASAVRGWGDEVAKYKGRANYGDVLLRYLDEKHKEQVQQGIINEDDVKEKDVYPY